TRSAKSLGGCLAAPRSVVEATTRRGLRDDWTGRKGRPRGGQLRSAGCSGALAAPDPQLPHAAAERVRVKLEGSRRSPLALDYPTGLFQGRHDVVSLHLFQRGELR